MEKGRFEAHHMHCLTKISQLKGLSGNIVPGQSVDTSTGASASVPSIKATDPMLVDKRLHPQFEAPEEDTEKDLEEEEEAEDAIEEISSALVDLLSVSDDA